MRKLAIAFVVLGMALAAVPAFAVTGSLTDEPFTGVPGQGSPSRSNDCPGDVVWDTGMFDEFTVPAGCSSATSSVCFVNAADSSYSPPGDLRRTGDDFLVDVDRYITGVKVWARYSNSGDSYHLAYPASLHGFCVKFYEQDPATLYCPDGSVQGEFAIGTLVYDQYCPTFTEYQITTGVPRNWNACITLPVGFAADPTKIYHVSVSGDFDFVAYEDPAFPGTYGVTQWFSRLYTGASDPYCEASWWDTWSTPVPWTNVSTAFALPCWAGWNLGFVLYAGEPPPPPSWACCVNYVCTIMTEADCRTAGGTWYNNQDCDPTPCPPPVPTENKSWGEIKNLYSN